MENTKRKIKAELKAKGFTQTVLARRLRCSIPFLSNVIAGKRTSKRIRAGLAAYLNKSVSDLWPDQHEEKSS